MASRMDDSTVGSSNERPFPVEAHEYYGQALKETLRKLETLHHHVKESHLKNKDTLKNIETAKKAVENIQVSMHRSLMSVEHERDDSELALIYLGRLSNDK
jgi:predicted patatin/cPLA2 family phospholipase